MQCPEKLSKDIRLLILRSALDLFFVRDNVADDIEVVVAEHRQASEVERVLGHLDLKDVCAFDPVATQFILRMLLTVLQHFVTRFKQRMRKLAPETIDHAGQLSLKLVSIQFLSVREPGVVKFVTGFSEVASDTAHLGLMGGGVGFGQEQQWLFAFGYS